MPLTMAQGIRRLGMPIAAFLGVALISLVAASWLLNRDALRAAVEAQIRAVTGLDLVVKGATDISVFPASYVAFHDVGLRGGGTVEPALAVDNQVSFSQIRIQDGTLSYEDVARHQTEKLDNIDLSLAWPSISRSFA